MKFKKIEISAFRIYDKPENATFDFSVKGDEIADFVSLYAPNGYGKTSFYDAVEWGMTNNIQRFWQNKTITNGAIEALANQSDSQIRLWRNIHSKQPTYVKIFGEGIEPIDRKLKPHGNKKSDADIDGGGNLENRNFSKVILSQEWISAFLREIDGNKRYEIFMDNPDLKDVNSYYKNIKALLNYCQSDINSIDNKIGEEQKRISHLENENILEKINEQIDILTDKFQQPGLNKLTLSNTKEEVSRFRNLIVERISAVNEETAIREKIEWVSAAKVGNDDYIGVRTYFELESRNRIIEDAVRNIRSILAKFSDVDKKTNEADTFNKLLFEKQSFKNDVQKIINQFEEYSRVSRLLTENENKSTDLRAELNIKSDNLSSLEIQETETRSGLNSNLEEVSQLKTTIAGLPDRFQMIQRIQKYITAQHETINQEKERLKPLDTQFKDVGAEIRAFEEALVEINKGTYSKRLIEDQVLALSIDGILADREMLSKNNALLESISERIKQQETLNSEISAFVRQGLEIVNTDRERTTCPLCEQTFKSHQELADRIANNNALDNLLKGLFTDKNRLEQESARLQELINNATTQLRQYFEGRIKDKQEVSTAVSEHIKTLNQTISSLEEKLKDMQEELRQLTISQMGQNNDEYEGELKKRLETLIQNEEKLNATLKKQTQDKKNLNDLLSKLRDKQKLVFEAIDTLKQSELYAQVVEWFRANISGEDISSEALQHELKEKDELIKEYFEKVNALKTEIDNLKLELGTYNQQAEKERLENLTEEKRLADTKVDGFRRLLIDKLEIESQFIDLKTLSATLDLKEQGFNLEQINNKGLIDGYGKVERYADHINEFLQTENAKLALDRLVADKAFLEVSVRTMLSAELKKTKDYLQDKVKKFFYETLINDLYRKIDPHPDFKEVYFSADFDADHPRLDVFVRDKVNQKIDLIPNLYFSTAQINILSLSIFLATALNTAEYDCIFIDDPIQSMDSVNILSTIDLLRSLVINYNKQIILSTHDETFFNLLKKKMPSGPFNSKFLELESVGKVKTAV